MALNEGFAARASQWLLDDGNYRMLVLVTMIVSIVGMAVTIASWYSFWIICFVFSEAMSLLAWMASSFPAKKIYNDATISLSKDDSIDASIKQLAFSKARKMFRDEEIKKMIIGFVSMFSLFGYLLLLAGIVATIDAIIGTNVDISNGFGFSTMLFPMITCAGLSSKTRSKFVARAGNQLT